MSALRIVSAVSWPGVQMTTSDTPRNARYEAGPLGLSLVLRVGAQGVGATGAAQAVERLALKLAHGLAARPEPAGDLVERPLVPVRQAEPQLDHTPHAPVERAQHLVHLVSKVRLQRRRGGRLRLDVLDQVPELGVALLADRRLERNSVAGGPAQGLDLQRGQPELLPDLLVRRLAAEGVADAVRDADQLVGLIADVDRKPDGAGLVADRPQDRKSTRLNSSHPSISYAVFCLKKTK